MKPNVVFSCVVDSVPKFKWQCTIFVNTLIHLAGVDASQIYVHIIEPDQALEEFLQEVGVNVVSAKRWGDGKYCNKLTQFDTYELSKADFIFLCDCDLAFTADVRAVCDQYSDSILGKTVDGANPPLNILEEIFKKYNIKPPEIVDTFAGKSFVTNFNGGFLGIPGVLFTNFGEKWRSYASQLLSDEVTLCNLDKWSHHVDQISFSMALSRSDFSFQTLGVDYNAPIHSPVFASKCNDSLKGKEPMVLHYHSALDNHGLIKPVGYPLLDASIKKVNQLLHKKFNNKLFWDFRYSINPDLGSGIGSRGKIVPLRRKLLKLIGIEDAESVLDIGFGDLEVITPFEIDDYSGVDISKECVIKAKEKRPQGKYYHYSEKELVDPHDLVICLDVLIHQDSLSSFNELIDYLIRKTKRRLVVNGFVKDPRATSSMVFFYKGLEELLRSTGQFSSIQSILLHKNKSVLIADKISCSANSIWEHDNKINRPSLYVHIGSPKTGTTALQKFIRVNRDTLENNNLRYPDTASKAMNYLAFSMLDSVPELVHQLPIDMNELYATLELGGEVNVISAEAFFVCSSDKYLGAALPTRLRLLLTDKCDVKIIVYLRRQDKFIESIYSQYVKLHAHSSFYTKTIQDFIEEYSCYLDYYKILSNWAQVFGRENIIVRVYEKGQLKDCDIVSDFISTIGLPLIDKNRITKENDNPRIGRDELEYKRLINALSLGSNIKIKVIPKALLLRSKNNKYFQSQLFLSPSERLKIIDKYNVDNQQIAKEFMSRKNGALFLEAEPTLDDIWQPYEGLSKETAVSISSFLKINSPELFPLLTDVITKDIESSNNITAAAAKWLRDCF